MNEHVKPSIDNFFLQLDLKMHRARNAERSSRIEVEPTYQALMDQVARCRIATVPTETGKQLDQHMVSEVLTSNDANEGSLTAVIGASHSGKSHFRERLELMKPLQPRTSVLGERRPLLSIVAPSPCTLKALGTTILTELDPPDEELEVCVREAPDEPNRPVTRVRKIPTQVHAIWNQVHARLKAHGVAFVFIDEIHNVLIDKGAASREATAKALKTLMVAKKNPIHLVLFGTAEAEPLFNELKAELNNRTSIFEIEPLESAEAVLKFGQDLTRQYDGLSDKTFWEDDMPERLLRASKGHRGRIAKMLYWLAEATVLRDLKELDRQVLGEVYGTKRSLGPHNNPFLIANPAILVETPEMLKEEATYWDCLDRAPKPSEKRRSVRPVGHSKPKKRS